MCFWGVIVSFRAKWPGDVCESGRGGVPSPTDTWRSQAQPPLLTGDSGPGSEGTTAELTCRELCRLSSLLGIREGLTRDACLPFV